MSLVTLNEFEDEKAFDHISSSSSDQSALNCQINIYEANEASITNHCVRVNTVPAYFEMNRQMNKDFNGLRIAATAEISPNAQIGPDSIVGKGTKVNERCSIKKSVVGMHCTIGKTVKLTNCVIMDYVTIEDL